MGYLSPERERLLHTRSRIRPLPAPPDSSPPVKAVIDLTPSDEDKKLLADLVSEIRKRQSSSSENFDKSVLTLSSGGLAFSLGFLKDFVQIGGALWPWTLYVSWIALTAATVVTMLSFLASARAQDYQQEAGEAYYLRKDEARLNNNPWDRVVIWMNRLSGASFIIGVILTTLFVAINLERAQDMKNQPPGIAQDGIPSPLMQKVSNAMDLRRGDTSPRMTPSSPARQSSTPAPAPAPVSPAQSIQTPTK